MKTMTAVCATLVGAVLLGGGPALADGRCAPGDAAAGLCAPLHFVDDNLSREELLRMRAYERGYRDALDRRSALRRQEVAPPPEIALDGKEGYSQGRAVHRRYLDRHGNLDRRYDDRGYDDRDEYYERRARPNDQDEVVDFATRLLLDLAN